MLGWSKISNVTTKNKIRLADIFPYSKIQNIWYTLFIKSNSVKSFEDIQKMSIPYTYVASWHGLHGLPNKVWDSAKKLTHGRRFWHGLHGLKIKLLKIFKWLVFRKQ